MNMRQSPEAVLYGENGFDQNLAGNPTILGKNGGECLFDGIGRTSMTYPLARWIKGLLIGVQAFEVLTQEAAGSCPVRR